MNYKELAEKYFKDTTMYNFDRFSIARRVAVRDFVSWLSEQRTSTIGADQNTPSVACEYEKRLVCEHGNCMIGCSTCHPPMP